MKISKRRQKHNQIRLEASTFSDQPRKGYCHRDHRTKKNKHPNQSHFKWLKNKKSKKYEDKELNKLIRSL